MQSETKRERTQALISSEKLLKKAIAIESAGLHPFQRKIDGAIITWESVPGMSQELLYRAKKELEADEYDKVLEWCSITHTLDPRLKDIYYYEGRAYEGKEQWQLAIDSYKTALRRTSIR